MSKLLFAARLLCGIPLLSIGLQHLIGTAPMLPILEGAGLPFPELTAIVAPVIEVIAATLLLLGLTPRIAGLAAAGSMIGAIYAHVQFDWADEPPMALPVAMLVAALLVAARGSGVWALGNRASGDASPAPAEAPEAP